MTCFREGFLVNWSNFNDSLSIAYDVAENAKVENTKGLHLSRVVMMQKVPFTLV